MKKETLNTEVKHQYTSHWSVSLVTTETELRICWIINQLFGIALTRSEYLEIPNSNGNAFFSHYYHLTHDEYERYDLLGNRKDGAILVNSLKKVDYFLIIQSQSPNYSFESAYKKLKEQSDIIACIPIDPIKYKTLSIFLV